jgi:hypothetical protein
MQQVGTQRERASHQRILCETAGLEDVPVLFEANNLRPIAWPEHFPPDDWWGRFFTGIPPLGPSISFFRRLERIQSARTPEMMSAWKTKEERTIALTLGESLQGIGWKTPYFIPDDQVVAVIAGPSFGSYVQQDLAYLLDEFNRKLGNGLKREFFRGVIQWSDPGVKLGELVVQVASGLAPLPPQWVETTNRY